MIRKNIIVRLVFLITIIFILLLIRFPSIFAGILYPKVEFSIYPVDREYGEDKSFLLINVWRHQFSQFKQPVRFRLRKNKPYEQIYIKEISYEFDGNSGVYLKNISIILSWIKSDDNNGWYTTFFMLRPVNFRKIFCDKTPGEKFEFKWIVRYHYDDEPEQTEIVECTASAIIGTLRLPIPVFFPM